jgi:hypothetical protein
MRRDDIHQTICCGKYFHFKVITQLFKVIYINEKGWKYSDKNFFCTSSQSSTEEEEKKLFVNK